MNVQNQEIVNDLYEYSLFQMLNDEDWEAIRDALHYEMTAHLVEDFDDCDMVVYVGRLSLLINTIDSYLWSYDDYDQCGDVRYGLLEFSVGNKIIKTLQTSMDAVLNIWDDCFTDPIEEPVMFAKTKLLQSAYQSLFEDNEFSCYDLMRIGRD